jgi:regulator of PEP synthase PpsR (kinase-PPPase family)
MYANHDLPVLDSATTSVEEMSTIVLQHLSRRHASAR